jgi:predicted SnoaL-like aldol condensation-catalyzing enzyme
VYDTHRQAADQYGLAAHAHRTAAEHNERGKNELGNWHLQRALEYSDHAYKLAKEAHSKSRQIGPLEPASAGHDNELRYENHDRAAELHDHAADAHRIAQKHEKDDERTDGEHSLHALEHSQSAHNLTKAVAFGYGVIPCGHEEIATLAYELWEARGCPNGSPEEDWFRAEAERRSGDFKSWITNIQKERPMSSDRKRQVVELLKSIETGDPKPLASVNPDKYIQHNLAVADGVAGLRALFAALPTGSAKVNTVRVFQDGDYVFTHTDYNFFGLKIGFDIFRFEDGKIVEHWDNLQETAAKPGPNGHTMIDGPTTATDLDKTEANKALMQSYMDDLVAGRRDKFTGYFEGNNYIQHNPWVADNLTGLLAGLQELAKEGRAVKYDRVHMVLGEGNFILVVAEGGFGGRPTAYYDMYRIQNGKIAEHWDVLETSPSRADWENSNGKF